MEGTKKNLTARSGLTIVETMIAFGVVGTLATIVITTVNSRERYIDARDAEREHHVKQLITAMSNHIYSTQSTKDFDQVNFPTGEAARKHLCRPGQTHANCVNLDFLVDSGQLSQLPDDKTEQCSSFSGYEVYWGPGNRPFAKAVHTGLLPGDAPGSETCTASCGNASCGGGETCTSCPADCGTCAPVCGDSSCNGTETCSTCSGDCGICLPVCGANGCEAGETCGSCPLDCGTCPPVEYTIDTDVSRVPTAHQRTPSVVFVSDITGYVFFTDRDDRCKYSKTSDGGVSWGSAVQVTAQTDCLGIVVWYDQWTPGDIGTSIHILFGDASADDLWYKRLDTNPIAGTETFAFAGAEVSTTSTPAGPAKTNTLGNSNRFSITKATDGKLYAGVGDSQSAANYSYIVQCTSNCNTPNSWSEVGTNPLDPTEDDLKLLPLPGGKILLMNWDISVTTNSIRSKVWNGASWDGTWTSIGNATYRSTYLSPWGATVKKSNNDIYLVWNSRPDSDSGDFKTARYNSATSLWDTSTAPVTLGGDDKGYNCDIAIDESNGTVYVARLDWRYTVPIVGTRLSDVLVKSSTNDMGSWSGDTQVSISQIFPIPDDHRSLSLNMTSPFPLFAAWYTYNAIGDDPIRGTIIANP